MAQSFVGSNNMNYFLDDGQYGTRNMGGRDSGSPRYIYTLPEKWLYHVFHPDDETLLETFINENGHPEPKNLIPIIPMWAVNGGSGIGTGHSTFIPNYNPENTVRYLLAKIDGKKTPNMKPWYRNFKGKLI